MNLSARCFLCLALLFYPVIRRSTARAAIDEVCKVGGEVESSILRGYANKQHEGFLGHAYLGEWTNLGADTNNSDLKNNYKSVRVHTNGEMIDSGSMFVGLFMGDHSKCGINTLTFGILSTKQQDYL